MGRLLRGLALVAVLGGLAVLAGSAVLQWWEPPEMVPMTADAVANPPEFAPVDTIEVQVLNNGGVSGMAAAARGILIEARAGFDVVDPGNLMPYDREASVVLVRRGELEWGRRVADALAIPSYRFEPDSAEVYWDVTVLLGSDWHPSMVAARDSARWAATATSGTEGGWRGALSRLARWAEDLNRTGRP